MIDHTAQLQVSGRIADRHAEARAHRLAVEAASHGSEERRFWLTDGIRAATGTGSAIMARVRRVAVKPGTTLSAKPGGSLTPARYRP